jgi:hypothetical protein
MVLLQEFLQNDLDMHPRVWTIRVLQGQSKEHAVIGIKDPDPHATSETSDSWIR